MKELDADAWVDIISKGMSNIAKGLEKLSDVMVQFMGFLEAKQPDLEYRKDPKIEVSEEILQDLKNITVMASTQKAILAVKGGYQKWVPLSYIDNNIEEFKIGNQYDIELTKDGKWITKKAWEKFKPMKEGK